jgi:MSHA pilin protein MshD
VRPRRSQSRHGHRHGRLHDGGSLEGESRYTSPYFDNVNDYAGFSMEGIVDLTNTAVAGLGGYKASVSVVAAALDNVPATEALKITVTVLDPRDDRSNPKNAISLQGWRIRYAPTAAD